MNAAGTPTRVGPATQDASAEGLAIQHRVVRVGGEVVLHLRQSFARRPRGTLLYIHGLGESGLGFEGLMTDPRLADWDHLAPDLPGYGKNPWGERAFSLEEHALTLQWLLDELPLAASEGQPLPLVLVGHSMGGVIGTYLAESLPPGRVQGFVNVEGNISLGDCGFSSKVAEHSLDSWLAEGYAATLADLFEGGREEQALRTYFVSCRLCDPRVYHRNSEELVQISKTETLASRLARLGISKIYVYGSPRGTGEHSRRLLEADGITPEGIEDAGHWPFIDQPEAFGAVAAQFLANLS